AGSAEAARILEDPPGCLEAERLRCFPLDPRLAHALHDGVGTVRLQRELRGQQDGIVQIAPVIGELELIALADLHSALAMEHLDLVDELADVARTVPGVAAQGAADTSGNTDKGLQTRERVAGGLGDESGDAGTGAGPDALALDGDLRERGSR